MSSTKAPDETTWKEWLLLLLRHCVSLAVWSMTLGFFFEASLDGQSRVASPIVILEASSTYYGIGGHQEKLLLLRVTDDGKVEWDKSIGQTWERQTSSISADLVSQIKRTQDAIDESLLRGKMGPYYIYVDTSLELQIRMTAKQREVTFLVINPWSSGLVREPMPKDVKAIVCEINSVQSRVAKTPIDKMCKSSKPTQ